MMNNAANLKNRLLRKSINLSFPHANASDGSSSGYPRAASGCAQYAGPISVSSPARFVVAARERNPQSDGWGHNSAARQQGSAALDHVPLRLKSTLRLT
jgi:hypothetical protein